jgi:sialate O-acetylesterase
MNKSYSAILFLILIAIPIQNLSAGNRLKISAVFGSNMVIQRGINIPVWGTSDAGKAITIDFAGYKTSATIDENGSWSARLPVLNAGGPFTMKVYTGTDTVTFTNVLVGDVWLASGQSNMQMALSWGVNNKEEEIKNANYPQIRFFAVANDLNNIPQTDITGGQWLECNSTSVIDFSAVGYFFARQIHKELNVPVGIINSSWGGTDIQAWMSKEALQSIPLYKDTLPEIIAGTGDFSNGYEQFDETNKLRDSIVGKSSIGIKQKVFANEYADQDWKTMSIPCKWSNYGIKNYYGYVWFRKDIKLPEVDIAKDFILNLGDVSNENIAYFNGTEIQKLAIGTNIAYSIPAKLVNPGNNLISLRILGRWAIGGFNSPAKFIYLETADKSVHISLASKWKYNEKIEPITAEWIEYYNFPTFIYNAKIAPIIPYGLKGILWYQGENNTKKPQGYVQLFSLLINDWRTRWGQGYLPFIFAQLSNYGIRSDSPQESSAALIREAQASCLNLPNTAMVVNIDLGLDDGDVHFKNKQECGERFADAALGMVYGKNILYQSPVYKAMRVEGKKIRIKFENIPGGLITDDLAAPASFAIAGANNQFVWASAKIEGDEVVVWSDPIAEPIAVRYGWADNPDCNLYSAKGLPVAPFRTGP